MINKKNISDIVLLFIILVLFLIFVSPSVNAAESSINNSSSGGIKAAISNSRSGDTIYLTEGTYYGSKGNNNINININITIIGNGNKNKIIINGEKNQIFKINNKGQLKLINITLINGGENDKGGGINNKGTLIIQNCDFKHNNGQSGGAIYNDASMFINASNFINNTASTPGSSKCYGGAIYNEGIANITGSNFINNTVTSNNPANTYGGAIYSKNGDLNVSYSVFLNNIVGNSINSIYMDGGIVAADYNWWSTNNFTNIQLQLLNVFIKNYYMMSLTTNSTNHNININEPFFYTFSMYLNGTNEKGEIEKFSYLNTTIIHPNCNTEYFDGRTTQIWSYTPDSIGIYIVKALLDNQNLNLTFTANMENLL